MMNEISRAHFLKLLLAGAVLAPRMAALGGGLNELRGDRVGWARLKTPSQWWNRHAEGDPTPMQFLRENTTLNILSKWNVADAEDLDSLTRFPFIFTQEIDSIVSARGRSNLGEYLRRSGFLLIDTCINAGINPSPDACLQRQVAALGEVLPRSKVALLPSTHGIYRSHFQFAAGKPPHTFHNSVFDERWNRHGLYGIELDGRMAGVITLSGLQCAWAHAVPGMPVGHDVACMQMLANIYIYAMTAGS